VSTARRNSGFSLEVIALMPLLLPVLDGLRSTEPLLSLNIFPFGRRGDRDFLLDEGACADS